MSINLGQEPLLLILLIFLELLFVFIPAYITKFPDNSTLKEELLAMGFTKSQSPPLMQTIKFLSGVCIGFGFLIISDYLLFFLKTFITENIFGTEFLQQAEEGAINTSPVEPNIIEQLIITILFMLIVAPSEEAFFRGFIAKRFYQDSHNLLALLVSSTFFAIYHVPPFIVPIQTIITFFGYYFFFGFILAIIFKISKYSLIPVVVAHATFNFLLIFY